MIQTFKRRRLKAYDNDLMIPEPSNNNRSKKTLDTTQYERPTANMPIYKCGGMKKHQQGGNFPNIDGVDGVMSEASMKELQKMKRKLAKTEEKLAYEKAKQMSDTRNTFSKMLNITPNNPDKRYTNPYNIMANELGYNFSEYQQGGVAQQDNPQDQIMQMVAQALQQGTPPEEIMQMLVQQGVPQEQAQQIIQQVMSQMQGQMSQQQPTQVEQAEAYRQGGYTLSDLLKL